MSRGGGPPRKGLGLKRIATDSSPPRKPSVGSRSMQLHAYATGSRTSSPGALSPARSGADEWGEVRGLLLRPYDS